MVLLTWKVTTKKSSRRGASLPLMVCWLEAPAQKALVKVLKMPLIRKVQRYTTSLLQ